MGKVSGIGYKYLFSSVVFHTNNNNTNNRNGNRN